jgi:hypothetical protein
MNMMCITDVNLYPQLIWNDTYLNADVTYTGDVKKSNAYSQIYTCRGRNGNLSPNNYSSGGTFLLGNLSTSNTTFADTQIFNPRSTNTLGTTMLDVTLFDNDSALSYIGIDPAANLFIYKYLTVNAPSTYGGETGSIAISASTYTNVACITNIANSAYVRGTYVFACNPTSNNIIRSFHVNPPYPGGSITTDWQRQFGSNIAITNVVRGDSDNLYFVTGAKNSNNYIFSYDKNGNLLWQNQINNVQLSSINYANNYLYICGNTGSNVFLAKFDTSGTLQWQSKLSSSSTTLIPKSIKENNGNIVVAGTSNYSGFVLKVPNTGNITGNGNFILNGSNFTYGNSSLVISSSSQTNTVPTTANVNITNNFPNPGTVTGNVSIESINTVGLD